MNNARNHNAPIQVSDIKAMVDLLGIASIDDRLTFVQVITSVDLDYRKKIAPKFRKE